MKPVKNQFLFLIARTKSDDDKILKKRQKIAQLKDRLSEHEKSLEDYVEIGMIYK